MRLFSRKEITMRTDQYIGLNAWATALLEAQQDELDVIQIACHLDGTYQLLPKTKMLVPRYSVNVIEEVDGAWNEKFFALHRYSFPDGLVYEEFIQATPWSSGPCYFIALKELRERGLVVVRESLWTQEEIAAA